jgi:hypothetical protein
MNQVIFRVHRTVRSRDFWLTVDRRASIMLGSFAARWLLAAIESNTAWSSEN